MVPAIVSVCYIVESNTLKAVAFSMSCKHLNHSDHF